MTRRWSRTRHGFALVDVTIGVVVFALGVLAAIALFVNGVRLQRAAEEGAMATLRLEEVSDSLMWVPGASGGARAYVDGLVRWRNRGVLFHLEAWGGDTTGAPIRELWAPAW